MEWVRAEARGCSGADRRSLHWPRRFHRPRQTSSRVVEVKQRSSALVPITPRQTEHTRRTANDTVLHRATKPCATHKKVLVQPNFHRRKILWHRTRIRDRPPDCRNRQVVRRKRERSDGAHRPPRKERTIEWSGRFATQTTPKKIYVSPFPGTGAAVSNRRVLFTGAFDGHTPMPHRHYDATKAG